MSPAVAAVEVIVVVEIDTLVTRTSANASGAYVHAIE